MKRRRELQATVERLATDLEGALSDAARARTDVAELRKQLTRSEADADRWCATATNAAADLSNVTAELAEARRTSVGDAVASLVRERDKAMARVRDLQVQADRDAASIAELTDRIDRLIEALAMTQAALDAADITIDAQAGAIAEAVALAAKAAPHMPHGGSRTRFKRDLERLQMLLRPPT